MEARGENAGKSATIVFLTQLIEIIRKSDKTRGRIVSEQDYNIKFQLMDLIVIRKFAGFEFDGRKFRNRREFRMFMNVVLAGEGDGVDAEADGEGGGCGVYAAARFAAAVEVDPLAVPCGDIYSAGRAGGNVGAYVCASAVERSILLVGIVDCHGQPHDATGVAHVLYKKALAARRQGFVVAADAYAERISADSVGGRCGDAFGHGYDRAWIAAAGGALCGGSGGAYQNQDNGQEDIFHSTLWRVRSGRSVRTAPSMSDGGCLSGSMPTRNM